MIGERRDEAAGRRLGYQVMLKWEREDGVYTAWVPSLPGCITFGKSIEEAMEIAEDAIGLYIETLIALGETVPFDIPVHQ